MKWHRTALRRICGYDFYDVMIGSNPAVLEETIAVIEDRHGVDGYQFSEDILEQLNARLAARGAYAAQSPATETLYLPRLRSE